MSDNAWIARRVVALLLCLRAASAFTPSPPASAVFTAPALDLCEHNGRRLYLELGARGRVVARNVSVSSGRRPAASASSSASAAAWSAQYLNASSQEQCSLELVTCPGCVVSLIFEELNLPSQCANGVGVPSDGSPSPCPCDALWLWEPSYEESSGRAVCGQRGGLPHDGPSAVTFRSSTRSLALAFLYTRPHAKPFAFQYVTERNRQFLKGCPAGSCAGATNASHGGILQSPFFPTPYPRDLGVEYVIACLPDLAVSCRVRILFHDFQVDVASIMEFFDWNGKKLESVTGSVFRPPVILSSGPSLMIRFFANGGTSLGYKAMYSFVNGDIPDGDLKPDTDCGGDVENLGGAITMMNMVAGRTSGMHPAGALMTGMAGAAAGSTTGPRAVKMFDCVWLIRPPKSYLHLKTHLYLKVAAFNDMAGPAELVVRRGRTSAGAVALAVGPGAELRLRPGYPLPRPAPATPSPPALVTPAQEGFYVSLRAAFGPRTRLAVVYAAYSYSDCFTGPDALCHNHRCIPAQLYCDGFDHCGDNSDEPPTCFQDLKNDPQDHQWYSHTPNYYFPKMERYPDLKTATLVFVISCLGLILLIVALIILLYRMGSRARHQREIHNRLQTISDLLAANGLAEGSPTVEPPPDDPPVYEAPPDYDDVIKVFVDTTKTERRKLNTVMEHGDCDGAFDPLAALLPLPTPMGIVSRSCQTTPVPDSPPPPYCDVGRGAHSPSPLLPPPPPPPPPPPSPPPSPPSSPPSSPPPSPPCSCAGACGCATAAAAASASATDDNLFF